MKKLIDLVKKMNDRGVFDCNGFEPFDIHGVFNNTYEERKEISNILSDNPNAIRIRSFGRDYRGSADNYIIYIDDEFIKIAGTNYYILASKLEFHNYIDDIDDINNDYVTGTRLVESGTNRFSGFEEKEIISEIELSEKDIVSLKNYLHTFSDDADYEDSEFYGIVMVDNKKILNLKPFVDSAYEQILYDNDCFMSKNDLIERLTKPKEFFDTFEEFMYFCRNLKEFFIDNVKWIDGIELDDVK